MAVAGASHRARLAACGGVVWLELSAWATGAPRLPRARLEAAGVTRRAQRAPRCSTEVPRGALATAPRRDARPDPKLPCGAERAHCRPTLREPPRPAALAVHARPARLACGALGGRWRGSRRCGRLRGRQCWQRCRWGARPRAAQPLLRLWAGFAARQRHLQHLRASVLRATSARGRARAPGAPVELAAIRRGHLASQRRKRERQQHWHHHDAGMRSAATYTRAVCVALFQ